MPVWLVIFPLPNVVIAIDVSALALAVRLAILHGTLVFVPVAIDERALSVGYTINHIANINTTGLVGNRATPVRLAANQAPRVGIAVLVGEHAASVSVTNSRGTLAGFVRLRQGGGLGQRLRKWWRWLHSRSASAAACTGTHSRSSDSACCFLVGRQRKEKIRHLATVMRAGDLHAYMRDCREAIHFYQPGGIFLCLPGLCHPDATWCSTLLQLLPENSESCINCCPGTVARLL